MSSEPHSPAGKTNPITVAFAGNPNAGKSTIINAIAGSRLQVGNWPGVTVEKKEATITIQNQTIHLIDLPGTYSLSPYTQEEVVARDYLVHEKPDLIVNVIDTTNLERNLYLTVQLLELGIPTILVLNMYDEIEDKSYKLDYHAIEKILGVKAIPTIATKGEGVTELTRTLRVYAETGILPEPRQLRYNKDLEAASRYIIKTLEENHPQLLRAYPKKWLSYRLIEEDEEVLNEINIDLTSILEHDCVKHLTEAHDRDIETYMSDTRYAQAAGLTKEVLKKPLIPKAEITEKIDKIVLNRFLSIPIFLMVIWLMFKLTFDVANPFVDWIDAIITGPISRWSSAILTFIHSPDWLSSLVAEGIIGGVGFVLVFVPIIFSMMFFITFLEGCGYMARAAFVMDRYMHLIGLHGKSFIPMVMGFGCNVPGIYATRTLENPRDRALTALLLPLMSCSARLPVYVLFIGAFFENHKGSILFSLYLLGIGLSIGVGFVFRKTIFRGNTPVFIMELPPYRMPSLKNLIVHTWEKAKHFVIKAGTYILAMSVLIWFALNLPWGVENKQHSVLGTVAETVSPVFKPLGFGTWESTASLITGVVAKEIVISTLGEIYALEHTGEIKEDGPTVGQDLLMIITSFFSAVKEAATNVVSIFSISSISAEDSSGGMLKSVIQEKFTPLSAFAFMAFVLLYMPCLVTGIAMRHEFGSWKLFSIAVAYGMVLAWVVSFIIYQGGLLLGLG